MMRLRTVSLHVLCDVTIAFATLLQLFLIIIPFYVNKIYLAPEDDVLYTGGLYDIYNTPPFSWPVIGGFLEIVAFFSGILSPLFILAFSFALLWVLGLHHQRLSNKRMLVSGLLITCGIVVVVVTWIHRVRIVNWLTD